MLVQVLKQQTNLCGAFSARREQSKHRVGFGRKSREQGNQKALVYVFVHQETREKTYAAAPEPVNKSV